RANAWPDLAPDAEARRDARGVPDAPGAPDARAVPPSPPCAGVPRAEPLPAGAPPWAPDVPLPPGGGREPPRDAAGWAASRPHGAQDAPWPPDGAPEVRAGAQRGRHAGRRA